MKNIKDFNTFSGTDGYLIVDGTTSATPGGKKLLSEIVGKYETEDDVLDLLEEITPKTTSVLNGGCSLGVNAPLDISFDETLSAVLDSNNHKRLSVTNPLPSTTTAEDGYVLTYTDTDGIAWAAPAGGGTSDIPEYSADDENKVLGVVVDREWNRQTNKYDIIDTRLDWCNGIPSFPELGSAGDWGLEPVVKMVKKYNPDTGYMDLIETTAGAAGCPYNTFGPNNNDQYGTWRFSEWTDCTDHPYTVTNNTYVAEINNDWFINFGYLKDGYDAEYGDPSYHPDATSVLFKVKHHGAIIPFVCIEFINESGKSLTLSVVSEETAGGFGETLVPIADNGTTVNNIIPDNTFVQIRVLGHGYTIKTQSSTLPVH